MEKLDRLHSTIFTLKDMSEIIIKRALSLLQSFKNDDSDIVESIFDEIDVSIEEDKVMNIIASHIEETTRDAKRVLKEIDEFASLVIKGGDALRRLKSEFFKNIWFGDMYDCSKIKGLNALLDDLKGSLALLDDSSIIDIVTKKINNSEIQGQSSLLYQ